jgi:hypothetical protein
VVGRGQHPLAVCFATANAHRLRSDGVRWRNLVIKVSERSLSIQARSDDGRRLVSLGTMVGEWWSGPTGKPPSRTDVFPTDVA